MDFKALLKSRDLKATSKRTEVLQTIDNYGSAMPYSELQKTLVNFDRVTLYRTMNILIEKGIIHKASTRGQETYYAICSHHCTSEHHNHQHIHFKCTNCQAVSCVELKETIAIAIPNFKINNVEIEVSGICDQCN